MIVRTGNSADTRANKETVGMNVHRQIRHFGSLVALVAIAMSLLCAATVSAAEPKPGLTVSSLPTPTNFAPGDQTHKYSYDIRIANLSTVPTDGSDITITDTLPKGVPLKEIGLELHSSLSATGKFDYGLIAELLGICSVQSSGEVDKVTCTISESILEAKEPATLQPGEERRLVLAITAPPALPEGTPLTNVVEVEGGGAPPVSDISHNEASSAPAAGGFSFFRSTLTGADGQPVSQAASHPYQFALSFAVHTKNSPPGSTAAYVPAGGDIKDIPATLPEGMIGSPTATARCTGKQFSTTHTVTFGEGSMNSFFDVNDCPGNSVVGLVLVQQVEGVSGISAYPLYSLVPPSGMPAQFGAQILSLPFYINTEVTPDNHYKVVGLLQNLTQVKRLTAATVVLWGTPGDPRHDALRGSCLNQIPEVFPITMDDCEPLEEESPKPFLRLPTNCKNPLTFTLSFDTWTTPGQFTSETSGSPSPASGCNQVAFEPALEARPTTDAADSPSGLHVDLHIPQRAHEEPEELGQADLRSTKVTLPKGLAINPSGANGLEGCTASQVDLEGPGAAQCPDAARVGTVEVDTPLIDHPLPGSVYVAMPHENPFDSLLAIYIAVNDPVTGIVVKLAGKVDPDPVTGQLRATFEDTPQVPFEDFKLDFFGGAAAALRTPAVCGTYATASTLTPWSAPASGPPATSSDPYAIDRAPSGGICPTSEGSLPNAPGFDAGTVAPIAQAYSPLVIHLRRDDGSQEFSSLSITPPPGLLGKLAGIPYCQDSTLAQAAAKTGRQEQAGPSCPAASQVGTVTVGAGAGPAPYYTNGTTYLAGPYKGAPLSLAIVTPATAGPYDLGTVVVRTALKVDPETTRITADSDPIPHILQGIPLDVRTIAVKLDRPDFTLNPTNCDPLAISGVETSTLEQGAPLTNRFQVGECGRLKFAPRLSLRLKGGTRRSSHPRLRAELNYPKGAYANIARASVALPHSEFLDQAHIRTICTRVQFAAQACPRGAIYGHARAITPLLDKPLEGPVYLRSSSNPLPDLVADLNGQIHVVLVGRLDSVHGGIRTTFDSVPDAPVSKFVLSMRGGKKGLLVNSRNICAHANRAMAKFNAQNGKTHDTRPVLKAQCHKKSKRNRGGGKKHRGHRHAAR